MVHGHQVAVKAVAAELAHAGGFNTDGAGAVAALKSGLGMEPAGLTITLLGAGGAAKAVALALAE